MQPSIIQTLLVASLAAACVAPTATEDGEHDSIAAGKADSAYSDAEIAGALRAANELTYEQLGNDVHLSKTTARNIIDGRPFASVAELDEVPYVGSQTFAALVEYAVAAGWTVNLPTLTKIGGGGTRVAVTARHLATLDAYTANVSTYIRTGTTWTPGATLTIPGSINGFFRSLVLDGDTLAVTGNAGTSSDPDYRTYVFAYGPTGWTQTQVLDGGATALALSGDVLAVGDGLSLAAITGRVRLYRRTTATPAWQQFATLDGGNGFGQELALRDNLLAVGKIADGTYVIDLAAGAPTVAAMQRLATEMTQRITVRRDRIIVSSSASTAVDVFEPSAAGWARVTRIEAPAPLGNESPLFGISSALDGDHIVVGAPRTSKTLTPAPSAEGALYVYDRTGTLIESRLGERYSFFGNELAVRDGMYVVGGVNAVYAN